MVEIYIALIIILIIFAQYYYKLQYVKTVSVKSSVDGTIYQVSPFNNQFTAANTMAHVNIKITELLRHLRQKYIRQRYNNYDRQKIVRNLLNRYNPDNLIENPPQNPDGETSYTIGKGNVLALCLRSSTNQIHNINIITFVAIHELTHIGIDKIDHSPYFWSAFKFLLTEAVESRILYNINLPVEYCGLSVDYNPLYDLTIADI
jgi:hypothetical protein